MLTVPPVQGSGAAGGRAAPDGDSRQATVPSVSSEEKAWRRTLAAYRRAEARVAAFRADERALPAARRAWPACEALEERFGALDSRRLAILKRLLRAPAPDIAALALKLELAVADQAWELTGCETCLEAAAADARRLAQGA